MTRVKTKNTVVINEKHESLRTKQRKEGDSVESDAGNQVAARSFVSKHEVTRRVYGGSKKQPAVTEFKGFMKTGLQEIAN